jgi:hypothetical protein
LTELHIENDLVFLGIPVERFLLPEFIENRDRIQASIGKAGLAVETYQAQSHRVDRNRDKIVRAFLDQPKKPDWLLMLDSDMKHPTDIALRLIGHRVPVVGGLYFHRGTHEPLVFTEGEVHEDEYGRDILTWEFMKDEVYSFLATSGLPNKDDSFSLSAPGNPLLECDAIGTGCMLIHRSVLEAMTPPWFEYVSGGRSEDIHFCWRVRNELDLPIYADMSTISGHYQMVAMGQAQFRAAYRGRGLTASNYTPDEAVNWLRSFASFSESEADQGMADYHPRQLAEIWDKAQEEGVSDLEFYQQPDTGKMYLKDLLWWNASPLFSRFRNELMGEENQKVLIIGSGIGSTAIQLACQGCDVTAIEPNKVLRDFSLRRWKWTLEKKVNTRAGHLVFGDRFRRGQPRNYKFDLVVAIDVFEHLEEDVLVTTMEMLGNNVRVGGRMFVHNNWEQQDLYPMHRDHSLIWPNLMYDGGFIQTGELWLTKME